MNVELSSMLPGMPGTTRSASGTRHETVAVTWAGSPTLAGLNCLVSRFTTGLQSRPSALSAAWALDLAAARQGVDAARVHGAAPGAGPQAALAFARHDASGYLLGPSATDLGSTPTTIQIRVTGHVPTFVPGLAINISQVAAAPVEKFVAPAGP